MSQSRELFAQKHSASQQNKVLLGYPTWFNRAISTHSTHPSKYFLGFTLVVLAIRISPIVQMKLRH
jgi:hypothetical protein